MEWELSDWVGLAGAVLLLYAFWRNSSGVWQASSLAYPVANMLAAILLILYAIQKQAYANVALNVVWLIVAVFGVRSYTSRKRGNRKPSSKTFPKD